MAREKKTGWDSDAVEDFGRGEMLILSEDGEQAHFVPLTPPEIQEEDAFGGKRYRAVVMVARCGDDEIVPPADWYLQEYRLASRVFRQYKALAARCEGEVMLHLVRVGARNDTNTKYKMRSVAEIGEALFPAVGQADAVRERLKGLLLEAVAGE
jgi:hypothetical protein